MYKPEKEYVDWGVKLLMLALVAVGIILTVVFPWPARYKPEDYMSGGGTIGSLKWSPEVKRSLDDIAVPDRGGILSRARLIQKVVVEQHINGLVSGYILREEYKDRFRLAVNGRNFPDNRSIIWYRLRDDDLPLGIRAQVRRYDLINSWGFKGTYIAIWALLLIMFWLYPYVSHLWQQQYAFEKEEKSSLQEFKDYINSNIQLLLLRRGRSSEGYTSLGDDRPGFRYYWHDAALAALVVAVVIFASTWYIYLNPIGWGAQIYKLVEISTNA